MPTMTESNIRRIVAETIASLQLTRPPRRGMYMATSRRGYDEYEYNDEDDEGSLTMDSNSTSGSGCSTCCCSDDDDDDDDDDRNYQMCENERCERKKEKKQKRKGLMEGCYPVLKSGDWGGRVEGVVRYPGEMGITGPKED
ncbi:hypothetical protein ACHAQH_007386 [Verticillium albo-atrum]